jgi:sugar phosphate isomerase/epimerase
MLREIRELGFEFAELGHGIRLGLVPGILEAVAAGEIRISSLHNFCPLPVGVLHAAPNLYQFSAQRPREWELALKQTRKTLDMAERVRAEAVVLHLGSLEARDPTPKLLKLVGRGRKETPRYERLCARVAARRERKKGPYVERSLALLRELLPEAERRGLRLGAENRQSLIELPLDEDFHFLFREAPSPSLGYWHDTGHAQIKEHLGFIRHELHLESLRDRLIGFHIHDVVFPGQDHCAPGTGTVDFGALKPLVRPEHFKVFELGPDLTVEQARSGVEHVKKLWGE